MALIEARDVGEGAIRIDVEIQAKIRHAEFFVGDVTVVCRNGRRLLHNENVLVEVGYALASKKPQQIILLAIKRTNIPATTTSSEEHSEEQLRKEEQAARRAFDIDHVARIEFAQEDKPSLVRDRIQRELEAALKRQKRIRD